MQTELKIQKTEYSFSTDDSLWSAKYIKKKTFKYEKKRKLLFFLSPVMSSKFVSLDVTFAESEIHCKKCDEAITYSSKIFWTSA